MANGTVFLKGSMSFASCDASGVGATVVLSWYVARYPPIRTSDSNSMAAEMFTRPKVTDKVVDRLEGPPPKETLVFYSPFIVCADGDATL